MTPGRGFAAFNGKGERSAFGLWMRDLIKQKGGRAHVAEVTGISNDSLSKWAGGRAVPSKINVQKLIDAGIIEHATISDLTADSPWLATKYRGSIKQRVNALEVATVEMHAPLPAPANLLDAVMAEPGLTVKQRAQLAGIIAMVVNGVDLDISLSPKRG